MFCTALNYICMRILGEGPDGGQNNACSRARKWILDRGTVKAIPSWGKTWLSVCITHYEHNLNLNMNEFHFDLKILDFVFADTWSV